MGAAEERTWDARVLDKIASGVDPTIIRENLRLTPTERVEKMLRALALVDELRKAYGNRSPGNPPGAR